MKMFSITTVKFSSFHSRFFRIQIHPIHKPIPEIQRQTLRIVYVSTDQHLADPATWNGSMGTGEWKYGRMGMGTGVWKYENGSMEWEYRSTGMEEWEYRNESMGMGVWGYGNERMGMGVWE